MYLGGVDLNYLIVAFVLGCWKELESCLVDFADSPGRSGIPRKARLAV